jgi:secreted PhoX family phosphatase
MTQAKRLSRRHFLLGAAAGGAATAAAIVAKSQASAAQPSTGSGKRATRGYQMTEHVNNYIRTTKI